MRVKIFNEVFKKTLTPNEAKVYVYLIACANRLNNAVVRIDTIRTSCCIGSRSTVSAAIQGLCSKGLVTKYRRRSYDGDYIANGYNINQLQGGWFFFDTNNMKLFQLDKSTFFVYLYLTKCKRHNSRKAFPSLRKAAAALRVCVNTIIAAIRKLGRLLLIKKNRPSQQGRLNIYVILDLTLIQTANDIVGSHATVPSFFMLAFFSKFVNSVKLRFLELYEKLILFLRIGGSFFVQQYLDPVKTTVQKEISKFLSML